MAKRLVSDGVNVKIDKWDLKEGQDIFEFLERMVSDENVVKVLLICDKQYAEKANSRKGGVGTETQIITPEIYKNSQQVKFLPIIFERDENGKEYLPVFLKNRIYIDLSIDEMYEEEYLHLLRVIYERPENQQPPIGNPPSHIFEEKAGVITKTFSKVNQFKNVAIEGKPSAIGIFTEYLDNLFSILDSDFKIDQENITKPFEDHVIESINAFLPYRDEFLNNVQFLVRYRMDISYFHTIYNFFNKLLGLMINADEINQSIKSDNYKFIGWELFLYVISILIIERRFEEFQILVEKTYFLPSRYSSELYDFHNFRCYIRSLDEILKQKRNSNLISVATNELIQRTYTNVPFDNLIQADIILFLRSKKLGDYHYWFPATLIYSRGHKFEFFVRSEEKKEFADLLRFINYKDKDELIDAINADGILRDRYFMWSHISLSEMVNLKNIGTR